MITIDLSKQQALDALDANPKSLQKTNFTENLDQDGNRTKFFIIGEVKETILDFSEGTVEGRTDYFTLI